MAQWSNVELPSLLCTLKPRGTGGITVVIVRNGHGYLCSNPG